MRDRRGTGRLRESGWRASATRGDPRSGDRPSDRGPADQPGRSRGVGGRHGRRDGSRTRGLRSQPPLRSGRLRPPRRRPLHARRAVPDRRRVRCLPARADGRLQPGGCGAHRADLPSDRLSVVLPATGRRSWRTSGPRPLRATWMRYARRWATTRSTTWATAMAPNWGPLTSSGSATTSGRWCSTARSTRASARSTRLINQEAGFQTAFNDYAADCARSPDCPLGTDPNQWVARYHQLIDPLVTKPAPTSEGRSPRLRRRDHGHHQRALHPAVLEIPHQRPAGLAARRRSR